MAWVVLPLVAALYLLALVVKDTQQIDEFLTDEIIEAIRKDKEQAA